MPTKLRNSLDAVLNAKHLPLSATFTFKTNELTVKVPETGDQLPEESDFLMIDLWPA